MMNLNSGKRQSTSWRWRNDLRSERNLCNCVRKPEKKKFRTWIPEFFSGFFTQLHKLRSLRRSFLHLHFISAVHIWFISYIINKVLPAIRKVKLSLPNWILVPYTYNVYQIRSNVFAQSMIFSIRESHKKCWTGTILSFKKAAPSSRRSCTTFLDLHVIFSNSLIIH